jgi:hypothetical protein
MEGVTWPWQALADAVLVLHFAVVVFVVGGLVAVLVGNLAARWRWVNHLVFRFLHLLAIGVVVVQAWLGQHCPLTLLESWLRVQAGTSAYRRSFIEHWLQRIVFHEAPLWVFTLAYTGFGALVLLTWWRFPPRRP